MKTNGKLHYSHGHTQDQCAYAGNHFLDGRKNHISGRCPESDKENIEDVLSAGEMRLDMGSMGVEGKKTGLQEYSPEKF